MNLNKHMEFFNPINVKKEIHIIGCGAIGGYVAQQLVKLGVTNIHLWDFDVVEEHNLTNQIYDQQDIGDKKVDALYNHLFYINKDVKVTLHEKYEGQTIQGYIFMCVDSVELRKEIIEANQFNMNIDFLTDGRIALTGGQVFAAKWSKKEDIEQMLNFCQFKDDEVEVPVSACGTTLSVSPSVLVTVSYVVANFINYIRGEGYQTQIHFDAFSFKTKAYSF